MSPRRTLLAVASPLLAHLLDPTAPWVYN
uniref:Uncharacterized protein n=1 Tax=Arundo donax TaxID=35708 RepID=A0A0A9C7D3_ARUDO